MAPRLVDLGQAGAVRGRVDQEVVLVQRLDQG